MPVKRTETPTRFKTNVTRQVVQALRDVFESGLFDDDFPLGVNIVNQYPLSEVLYPAVIVSFNPDVNETAGVGHEEWFDDSDGNPRTWQHRKFGGSFEFTAVALDPMERDILSDALVDILAFSHFTGNANLSAFFTRMQLTPEAIGTVFQVNLDSDRIMAGGTSTSIAPWEPEDVLLYEATWTAATMGGYYNTVLADWPGYVMDFVLDPPFVQSFEADVVVSPSHTPDVRQLVRGLDAGLLHTRAIRPDTGQSTDASTVTKAGNTITDDFETDFSQWLNPNPTPASSTNEAPVISNAHAATGAFSAKFNLANSNHFQYIIRFDPIGGSAYDTWYYAKFNIFVPAATVATLTGQIFTDAFFSMTGITVNQGVDDDPSGGGGISVVGNPGDGPYIAGSYVNNDNTNGNPIPITADTWHEVVIGVRIDSGISPYTIHQQLWVDGVSTGAAIGSTFAVTPPEGFQFGIRIFEDTGLDIFADTFTWLPSYP